MKNLTFTIFIVLLPTLSFGQIYLTNYFDGPTPDSTLQIEIDSNSIWQIGQPQKTIFNSAFSNPNALMTDTADFYRSNDSSSFEFTVIGEELQWGWGILAIQWTQKLDYEAGKDGGTIQWRFMNDSIWYSAFDNPTVYNIYGFDPQNLDTLTSGEVAFTGVDTTWKNIWFCLDVSWLNVMDTGIVVKFTNLSDNNNTEQEGWILDNFNAGITFVHTVEKVVKQTYLNVYPTITTGRINIETEKLNEFHIIEQIQVFDISGRLVQQHGASPTKYYIDIGNQPNGVYFVKVRTNKKSETIKVVLQK